MSCCPPGSWGSLKADAEYKCKGTVETLGDLPVYKVGDSSKCLIWNYDVFGFNGGRTRQFCDQLAEKGFMVLLPDYYRGKMQDPKDGPDQLVAFLKSESNWESLAKDWSEKIKPFAQKHGAKVFGAIGTCWGSYVVLRLCGLPEFRAGVSLHPSHPFVLSPAVNNEDEKAVLEAVKTNKAPQIFMPAKEDMNSVKKGGLGQQVLGADLCEVIEFDEMSHGWTVRGDLSISNVSRDVNKAMSATCEFLTKHVA